MLSFLFSFSDSRDFVLEFFVESKIVSRRLQEFTPPTLHTVKPAGKFVLTELALNKPRDIFCGYYETTRAGDKLIFTLFNLMFFFFFFEVCSTKTQ